ncbi:MAG: hypothetical protein V2A66_03020 [Pseudomonadota bacterium]
MLPVIIFGIAVGSAIFFSGCKKPPEDHPDDQDNNIVPKDTGAAPNDISAVPNDISAVPKDAGVDISGANADMSIPLDAAKSDTAVPVTPNAPAASSYTNMPCAFPASLAHDPSTNTLLAACGGAPNALFRSQPLGQTGKWTQVGVVGGYPAHHIQLDNRFFLVNHGSPDGFTIIDAQTGLPSSEIAFSALAPRTLQNQPLGFTPNNPAGAIISGATLCIATSNLNHFDADPAKTTFYPGTVLCMPYKTSDGTVNTSNVTAIVTSGINTTGMTACGAQRFAVLSSGSYSPNPNQQASLDICTLPSMNCTATPLGAITAQISPTLALTQSGMILIGVQKPSPKVLGVSSTTGQIAYDRNVPEVQNFITSIATHDHVAALSDFGQFGKGSAVLFADVNPNGWTGIPSSSINGSCGPSVVIGDALYQSVTDNAGAAGSVWKLNMAGM